MIKIVKLSALYMSKISYYSIKISNTLIFKATTVYDMCSRIISVCLLASKPYFTLVEHSHFQHTNLNIS